MKKLSLFYLYHSGWSQQDLYNMCQQTFVRKAELQCRGAEIEALP